MKIAGDSGNSGIKDEKVKIQGGQIPIKTRWQKFLSFMTNDNKVNSLIKNISKFLLPAIGICFYIWLFDKNEMKQHVIHGFIHGFPPILSAVATWVYAEKVKK